MTLGVSIINHQVSTGLGVHRISQHAVNFFQLVGVSVSAEEFKDMAQNVIYSP